MHSTRYSQYRTYKNTGRRRLLPPSRIACCPRPLRREKETAGASSMMRVHAFYTVTDTQTKSNRTENPAVSVRYRDRNSFIFGDGIVTPPLFVHESLLIQSPQAGRLMNVFIVFHRSARLSQVVTVWTGPLHIPGILYMVLCYPRRMRAFFGFGTDRWTNVCLRRSVSPLR